VNAYATTYGVTSDNGTEGLHSEQIAFPKICNLAVVPPTASACTFVGSGNTQPHAPWQFELPYGPVTEFVGQCQVNPDHRCFGTEQPTALAADPNIPNRIYAAFQSLDQDETAIFFTRSTGGASFGTWSVAVPVHPHTDNRFYIDPAISVDAEGTLIVTYSAYAPSEPGDATTLVAWSSNGGVTWSAPLSYGLSGWNANALPYHCDRQVWFLGEYRYPAVLGGRAIHLVHSGGTESPYQAAQAVTMMSRWSLFNTPAF
jgi:hypothetical protein